jgi:6-phosphogluconolactonase
MSSNYMIYVGTYTHGDSEGVYVYKMDGSTGALEYQSKATGIDNPTFLTLDPKNRNLYVVSEIDEFQGQATGTVTAYSVSPVTGELSYINRQLTRGTGPCHVQVNAMGGFLLLSNYGSGSVTSFPIQVDGSLGEAISFIQHEGFSINQSRQQGPHAHSINLDSANRFAFAPDLGTDRVMSYRFDVDSGLLEPHDPPFVMVSPGAGPRHFDFHPNGQYAYVINELDSTITAFGYDPEKGTLDSIQTVSTLPEGFDEDTTCADIHVSPDGRFVYGSNRGHNSIARFSVSETTGRLTPIGHTPTQGAIPRNFGIDPTGTFLLAANQDSDTIITFRVDTDSGDLIPTGNLADVPMPVCIRFMPAE